MNGMPTTRFNRWTGYYFARAPGNFVAFVENQEKYRFLIDDKVVIDHAETPKFVLAQNVVPLTLGPHKVVLEILESAPFTGERSRSASCRKGRLLILPRLRWRRRPIL
jgi:hypothetical protein